MANYGVRILCVYVYIQYSLVSSILGCMYTVYIYTVYCVYKRMNKLTLTVSGMPSNIELFVGPSFVGFDELPADVFLSEF